MSAMEAQPPNSRASGAALGVAQRLRVLDARALDAVHAASLRVLEQIGTHVPYAPALQALAAAGARVDGERVRLPAALVERAIASAPAQVTLYARDPRHNVYLGMGRVHFTNGFGATFVEDPESGLVRKATREDLVTFTRLADALERVDYVLFSVVPQDVPPALLDVECTATCLEHTGKHIQLSLETAAWVDEVVAMARAVAPAGTPAPVSAGGVPNTPLRYTADVAEKFMALARYEVPCFIVAGAMAGATAPVTLAGALALQNAEVLAGVVIHQLANPGAPVVYGTFTGGFDMRATKLALGGPEVTLISAVTQQLAERYGIPLGYATGGLSDSTISDVQCGLEKAGGLMFAALAGVDVVHDGASGLYGGGMVTSLRQMVVDDELCHAAAYWLRGMPVDEDSLAEEVIAAVGPGGHFLDTDHTARCFRKALYLAPLRARHTVEDTSSPSLLQRAAERAQALLASHQPPPLEADQRRALAAARARAAARLAGH